MFVQGEYRDARRTLLSSISRNHRHRRGYAEPVSDLYRANARVARHLGMDRDAEYSTWEILRTLRAGLPTEDYRHFTARLEVAQSLAQFGQRYDYAQRELRTLIERSRAAGRDDVVAMAELRILWLDYLQGPFRAPPPTAMLEMARSPDPRRSIGAKMMMIRIYSRRGETAQAEALIAELGRSGQRRQLLFSPPYELVQQENQYLNAMIQRMAFEVGQLRGNSNLVDRMVDNFDDKWIEVGFWIDPEGRVEGLETVRQRNDSGWARPLLQSIRARRYAAGDTRTYRLERYTYTSGYRDGSGTHAQQRSPAARVEYFDLSEGATPPNTPAQ